MRRTGRTLKNGTTTAYEYDNGNQVANIVHRMPNNNLISQYQYGLGRLVERDPTSLGDPVRRYYYDGWQVVRCATPARAYRATVRRFARLTNTGTRTARNISSRILK